MSKANVEVVSRGYEALNAFFTASERLDIDAWLDTFHSDAEVHDLAVILDAPVRRGHEDMRKWAEMMLEIWEDGRYEPQEFSESGKFVLVAVRAIGRGRGSGVPLEVPMFHVFEMRDGKVQRFWAYLDKADALQATGLPE